jgi:hypothetical protein
MGSAFTFLRSTVLYVYLASHIKKGLSLRTAYANGFETRGVIGLIVVSPDASGTTQIGVH